MDQQFACGGIVEVAPVGKEAAAVVAPAKCEAAAAGRPKCAAGSAVEKRDAATTVRRYCDTHTVRRKRHIVKVPFSYSSFPTNRAVYQRPGAHSAIDVPTHCGSGIRGKIDCHCIT